MLSYDDAYADLRGELLTVIKTFPTESYFENDKAVSSYIRKAVARSYVRLDKKKTADEAVTFFGELSDEQLEAIENRDGITDDYSEVFLDELKRLLTPTEFKILYRHYILGFTVADIANQDKIERQAVNQTKNRAIRKLKSFYENWHKDKK